MTQYIYSRVSTDSQSTEPQLVALHDKYPDARVISEVASGAKHRPMLKLLVSELKDGDALIVYALDRLGRRTVEVLQLIEELDRRKVTLISLREGVDYSTIAGRLVTQILVSLAEMERALISERTKAGLRAAREQGRMGGRPKSISQERIDRALQLVDGGMSTRKASKETGIHFTYIAELRRGRASE